MRKHIGSADCEYKQTCGIVQSYPYLATLQQIWLFFREFNTSFFTAIVIRWIFFRESAEQQYASNPVYVPGKGYCRRLPLHGLPALDATSACKCLMIFLSAEEKAYSSSSPRLAQV
jgi:hypothetical protein